MLVSDTLLELAGKMFKSVYLVLKKLGVTGNFVSSLYLLSAILHILHILSRESQGKCLDFISIMFIFVNSLDKQNMLMLQCK